MSDIAHIFGSDLSISPNGDLAGASGSIFGQQRVIRRLLTNPGDYIWKLSYGAGLPTMIGSPANNATIKGLVQSQIFLESAVAQMPTPSITVAADGTTVSLSISYSDSTDGSTQTVGATLTA